MHPTEDRDRLQRRRWMLVGLVLLLGLTAGAIYKWVDKEGKVHYSDQPPPGQSAQVVEVAPGPTAAQQEAAQKKLQELTTESAEISQRLEKERALRREAARQSVQEQAERRAACVEALQQSAVLNVVAPVYKRRPTGKGTYARTYITDAERVAELGRLQQVIAVSCSDDATARRAEQAEALQLEMSRLPWCVEMREEAERLVALGTAEARERLAQVQAEMQEQRATCREVPLDGVWLAQRVVVKR
jgi:hypothetical protein